MQGPLLGPTNWNKGIGEYVVPKAMVLPRLRNSLHKRSLVTGLHCASPPLGTHSKREREREGKSRMRGICGFDGGAASTESVSSVSKMAVVSGEDLAVEDGGGGAAVEVDGVTNEEKEEEEELELGLTLGAAANKGKAPPVMWGSVCRILTVKDFPSLTACASWRTPSATFASASTDANLGGGTGVTGTKRAAESVVHEVGGSLHTPSQAVVGWPPIRAFRMNSLFNHSKDNTSETDASSALKKTNLDTGADSACNVLHVSKDQKNKGKARRSSFFVKVKMDGDPIGRKVDLSAHNSYETLAAALELMFRNPTMHLTLAISTHGAKTSKLFDGTSEFALTYEDKDGDWMLVGDVPWGMFLETVKRLRIMRTSEANGLRRPVHFGKNEEKHLRSQHGCLFYPEKIAVLDFVCRQLGPKTFMQHEDIYPLRKISGSIGSSSA